MEGLTNDNLGLAEGGTLNSPLRVVSVARRLCSWRLNPANRAETQKFSWR